MNTSHTGRKPTAEVRLRGHLYEIHFGDDGNPWTVLSRVGNRNWRRVWERGEELAGIASKVLATHRTDELVAGEPK